MAAEVVPTQGTCVFQVAWKRKGDRSLSRGTYTADSIHRLFKMLETAEGVTKDNVEELIVHQLSAHNMVREVFCFSGTEGKPRIKLAVPTPTTYEDYETAFGLIAKAAIST